jgi:hypothetical protein
VFTKHVALNSTIVQRKEKDKSLGKRMGRGLPRVVTMGQVTKVWKQRDESYWKDNSPS